MVATLSRKETAKAAWDAIIVARIDSDHAHRSTLQKLRQKWGRLAFHPSGDVDDFAFCLSGLMQRLELYDDDDINEEKAYANC